MTFGSLFSGIGGFDWGLERAGMTCAWQVELDPQCRQVLARHWPDLARYEDVRDCGSNNLESVDLVCGGFPCQDVSVAGKRAGLAGGRSGLWYEFRRVVEELRPQWVLVENVPGLLSSAGGRDFAIILRGLAELGYLSVWRILDAQHFGVPQRRRRVFIVGHLGDGRAAEVLFESDCLPGDSAAGGQAGQDIAASLSAGSASGRGINPPGRRREDDVNLVARPISGHHLRNDLDTETYVAQCQGTNVGPMGALRRGNGNVTGGVPFLAQPLRAGRQYSDMGDGSANVVAHTLRGEGADASEDGTGRGTPMVWESRYFTRGGPCGGAPSDKANALKSNANNGDGTPLVFEARYARNGRGAPDTIVPPLKAQSGQTGKGDGAPLVATFDQRNVTSAANRTRCEPGNPANTLHELPLSIIGAGVRRLTPTECERLQGFPDGHTAGQSDSARYRQLGNAVAVPVVAWIGRAILAAEGQQ